MSDCSTIDALRAALGDERAYALVAAFGGEAIYVPKKRVDPDHAIAHVIGVDGAHALSSLCGGEMLAVPRARRFRAQYLSRTRELRPRQIGRILGVATRSASRYLK